MVLGLRTKNRKGTTVQVDYVIHIQEIKPWPPSQSLRSLRSVLLQWENGERHSGSTSSVVPSVGSGVGDGKIEFNESFRFPVTFSRELSVRGGEAETFQKNYLELSLYEPRRDKTMKGQLLGNAVIDLAEYGIIKEAISISTPMNCKRSFRNTAQPVLCIKIQPFEKEKTSSSSRDSLAKETSLGKDSRESVSALMSEEYAEEAEIASFTDDDASSHSSLPISPSGLGANADSPSQNDSADVSRLQKENALGAVKEDREGGNGQPVLPLAPMPVKSVTMPVPAAYVSNKALEHNNRSSSRSSSVDLSSDPGSSENDDLSASNFSERSLAVDPKKSAPDQAHSTSSASSEGTDGEVVLDNSVRGVYLKDIAKDVHEVVEGSRVRENTECPVKESNSTNGLGTMVYPDTNLLVQEKQSVINIAHSEVNEGNGSEEATSNRDIHHMVIENKNEDCCKNGQEEILEKGNNNSWEHDYSISHPPNDFSHSASNVGQTSVKQHLKISQDAPRNLTHGSDVLTFCWGDLGVKASTLATGKVKHGKIPVRSSFDIALRYISGINDQSVKEIDMLKGAWKEISDLESQFSFADKVKRDARERQGSVSDIKIRELELRIEKLEGELREAAALEVGLYSVVADHGSSAHKVHAPARRLSRMYIHARKHWSLERRASAARSTLSGLVLVAKACGNDVSRLAFWLSNSIVLRAIISEAFSDSHLPNSVGLHTGTNGVGMRKEKKCSPLRWEEAAAASEQEQQFGFTQILDDWQDERTFTAALEKIESWIFSRIIESVWWQTLTPYMQSPTEKGSEETPGFNPRKSYGRISSLGDQHQGGFSINLWKRAFKDACERLCPVRSGGHECGCLPVLARLVMEQCVARLDVAMFNALLRESVDEIPTDPVSDPISDSKVLPIPVGKSSFGAGAQLKNAIGTWSRWLTDLFGIDADDSPEDSNEVDDDRHNVATSFKSFHLLNALSDLLMLPKDMLLDKSIRKEVCPAFGARLIKRILWNFVSDEFCPDPIPEIVLEALDSEDSLDPDEDSIENFPRSAVPIVYSPPSAALVSVIVGNLKSPAQLGRCGSSVLRKSQTSDDELDDLDSPLASIAVDKIPAIAGWKSKEFDSGNGGNATRYQLLREVWMDGD